MNTKIIALTLAASVSTPLFAHTHETYETVISPDIPGAMTFCNKRVDLDRMDMAERLDRELTSLIYGHTNTLLLLKRANRYFPVIMPILRQSGVPDDLVYLACVESTLNPRAYSGAGAGGIWQFISSAAKEYGLEVSDEVDQRYDLPLATAAAVKYLKKAYNKYGDWPTAMASYNAGMGRISSSLDSQLADNSFDLYLNDETSRYVFRIMAMKAIFEQPSAFGFHLKASQLYQPIECDTVAVSTAVDSWPQWAKDHGADYARLREANPWIRASKLTNKAGKTYKVAVPRKNANMRSKVKPKTYNRHWVKD